MARLASKSANAQKQNLVNEPKNAEILEVKLKEGENMEQTKNNINTQRDFQRDNSSSFSYDVVEDFGSISEENGGWQKMFRLISWNGRPVKYDIREWQLEEGRMKKGITLTKEECRALKKILEGINLED